jgi:hypothetical protein
MRVLIRIPDLSPEPVTASPKAEVETFVQQPLAPLPAAPAKTPPKPPHHVESKGVTPDELKTTGRYGRPLTMLAVLALAAIVGVVLSNRARKPEAPADPTAMIGNGSVPGGSPTEITQIPEISFPPTPAAPAIVPAEPPAAAPVASAPAVTSPAPGESEALKIERLPVVGDKSNTAQASPDGATAQVSDTPASSGQQPVVAQLESRIEPPKSR